MKIVIITTIKCFQKNICINNIEILYYDRIDVSGGIDVNKARISKERIICRYWYFLDKRFKFQPSICNNCHDVLMIPMNFNDISVLNVCCANYCINGISKGEAVNLLQNADLREKSGLL